MWKRFLRWLPFRIVFKREEYVVDRSNDVYGELGPPILFGCKRGKHD